jgi:hypothetical protein
VKLRLLETGLVLLVLVLAVHEIYDPDFWLHLAAGDYMFGHHEILRQNQFSFSYRQHPWLNVYWLYQLGLSALWKTAGPAAVVAAKAVLSVALAAIVLGGFRDASRPLNGAGAVALLVGWLLLCSRLTDRPELVSFLLLAAMLALLRARRWWWCVPLQALWANVQGWFVLGPVMMAAFALGERRAWRAAAASVAACAVSPFGWKNFLLLRDFGATWRAFHNEIEELASPFHPVLWREDGTGWLLLAYGAIVATLLVAGRRKLSAFECLIGALGLGLAVQSVRAVPVFVLCSVGPALAAAENLSLRQRWLKPAVCALMLALAADFVAGTGVAIRFTGAGRRFGLGVQQTGLPAAAARFVAESLPQEARVLNAQFHTGGYLIWAWRGQRPVFVDGRLEAYPVGFVREYFEMFEQPAKLEALVERFAVTHLLVVGEHKGPPGDWKRVYADETAALYERKSR